MDICKLCGKVDTITDILECTILMLEDVVPELDTGSIHAWKLCNICVDSLQDIRNFKCRCIKNRNIVTSNIRDQETRVALEVLLPDLSPESEKKICRLCLKSTDCYKLFDEIKSQVACTEIYEKLLEELSINVTSNPVVCEDCKNTLLLQVQLGFTCSQVDSTKHEYTDLSKENTALQEESHTENLIIKKEPSEEDIFAVQPYVEEASDEPEPICGKDIKLEYSLNDPFEEQLQEAHKNNSDELFVCEYCPFVTKNKHTIKRHAIVHKDPGEITMFKCELCDFQTRYKRSIESHLFCHKSPEEVTMHKCTQCLYETKIKRNLVRHMVSHKAPSETTMFLCRICPFKTKYKTALNKHRLTHQTPEEIVYYSCDKCPYKAKRKGDLKPHMLIHQPSVIMFKCDQCPYQSKYKKSLKVHIATHKNRKDVYKCECCFYQTKYKLSLLKHKALHKNGDKIIPYK